MPQFAGVDLGSNSFHMVLGTAGDDGRVTFVDQAKEYVRLAGGLQSDGRISEDAIQRALECLARFGERLQHVKPERVRIVGTNTLRKARNAERFVERATEVLGHGIDIVSGLEEARLIFRGVSASFDRPGTRVVVDIGGGSTEIILGDASGPAELDSLHMGCVSWTRNHFEGGRIDVAGFERAEVAARRELAGISRRYRDAFDHAVGSSGTAKAIDRTLLATGLGPDGITAESLEALKQQVLRAGHIDRLELPEISRDRAQVLPGGLAILIAVVRSLRVSRMTTVDTAMREGILLELVGREDAGDVREQTVARMQARFGVDRDHAERVGQTAVKLFDQVAEPWGLPRGSRQLLVWAARLHEIGLFLRYSGYHKHGAYLIANGDLPGFSRQEQRALAALVYCHRARFDLDRIEKYRPVKAVPPELVLLLRMAVRLHRTRTASPRPEIEARASTGRLELGFPAGWLIRRPLTIADLKEERDQAADVGIALVFR